MDSAASPLGARRRKRDVAYAAGRWTCAELPRVIFTVAVVVLVLQMMSSYSQATVPSRTHVSSGLGVAGAQGEYARALESAVFTRGGLKRGVDASVGGSGASAAGARAVPGSVWTSPSHAEQGSTLSKIVDEGIGGTSKTAETVAGAPAAHAPASVPKAAAGGAPPAPAPARARATAEIPPGAIVVIFGTRPEAVKLVPVIKELRLQAGGRAVVAVNTGQHDALLHATLEALADGAPIQVDLDLNVAHGGSAGGPAETIATLVSSLAPIFSATPPALIIVQGDTTTAAAGALAAHLGGVPVAHVEAGLRSFSGVTPFPEEFYRTMISAATLLHFAPTQHAATMLASQGNVRGRVHVVGNPGIDGLRATLDGLSVSTSPPPTLASLFSGTHLESRLAYAPALAFSALDAIDNSVATAGNEDWLPPFTMGADAVRLPVYAKLCNPWCAGSTQVHGVPTCLQSRVQASIASDASTGVGQSVWVVFTMHRRESFGAPFAALARALGDIVDDFYPNVHVVWPLHPNPAVALGMREGLRGLDGHVDAPGAAAGHGAESILPQDGSERSKRLRTNLHVVEPLPADEVVALLLSADAVITDSGGLQEEAVALGKHVFVMRETTERPEALSTGLMHLVGTDAGVLRADFDDWLTHRCDMSHQTSAKAARTYGDGAAGARIASITLAAISATEAGTAGAYVPDGSFNDAAWAAAAANAPLPTTLLPIADVTDVVDAPPTQIAPPAAIAEDVEAEAPEAVTEADSGEAPLSDIDPDALGPLQQEGDLLAEAMAELAEKVAADAAPPVPFVPSADIPAFVSPESPAATEPVPPPAPASSGGRKSLKDIFRKNAGAAAGATGRRLLETSPAPSPYDFLVSDLSPQVVPTAHERYMRRFQCSAQPADAGVEDVLFGDVMRMESDYEYDVHKDSKDYTWTAIIGTYRRVRFLARMIESLLNQAHPPVEVWVTTFASPHEDALKEITRSFNDSTRPPVKWVAGDPQLKYFGRFQIAAQAPSTHVAFFDDDCIPGRLAVTNAFHMLYTKNRRFYGLIGMKGHWGPVEEPVTHIQHPYHINWEFRPPMAKLVDLTGGLWFLRRDWLHIMFRDNAFTLETGEDFQLTYTLRKYMGLPTHLLPVSDSDGETWAHSHDYFDVAKGTESTNGRLWDMRPIIFYNMMQRGYVPAMHAQTWGEHHTGSNVLIFLDHVDDAVRMRGFLRAIEKQYSHAVRPLIVISGGPGKGRLEADMVPALGREYRPHICCIVWLWDMYLRKLDSQPYRSTDVFAESLLATRGIVETTRPALIVVAHRRGSPVMRGVAEAASEMHVPTAALLLPDHRNLDGEAAVYPGDEGTGSFHLNLGFGSSAPPADDWAGASAAANAEADAVLEESVDGVFGGALTEAVPPAVQPFAGGASTATHHLGLFPGSGWGSPGDLLSPLDAPVLSSFAYATSSPGLLLRYVEQFLCVCEKADSTAVGAYAQCPSKTLLRPTPTPAPLPKT